MSSSLELQGVSGEYLSEVIDGKSSWVDPELDRNEDLNEIVDVSCVHDRNRVELDNEDLNEIVDVSCVHDRNRAELDKEGLSEAVDVSCVHDRNRVELDGIAGGGLLLDRAMTEGLLLDCVVRDGVGLDWAVANGVNDGAVVLDAVVLAWEGSVRLVLQRSEWPTSAEVMPASLMPGSLKRVEPVVVEQALLVATHWRY